MRLLICTQTVDERDPVLGFFHRWLLEFSKHCDSVEVICLFEGVHSLPDTVSVHSLGKETGAVNKFLYAYRFYRELFLLKGKYDAVFVHMNVEYVVLGGLYWKMKRIPASLWYVHASVPFGLKMAEKLVTYIFTVVRGSVRLQSEKVTPLGHGIDTLLFALPRSVSDTVRFSTISRISPSKDIGATIQAVSKIEEPHEFKIYGEALPQDASYLTEVKSLAKKLDAHIQFEGPIPQSEVPRVLAATDIFLNMSKTGGPDKAVLEAMAAGAIPVTANEACAEVLVNFTELIVPLGNASALAKATEKLIALPREEKEKLREKLRTIVRTKHELSGLISKIVLKLKADRES